MSRSIRKNPYTTELQGSSISKEKKRKANRRVRKVKEVASGGSFKRHSQSWDINDWAFKDPKAKRK